MKRIVYMTLLVMLLLSCNTRNNQKEFLAAEVTSKDAKQKEIQYNAVADSSAAATGTADDKQVTLKPVASKPHEDWDKKIIKTAEITLELSNYNKYNKSIHAELKEYGAYIASEEQNFTDERKSNDVTIKVPVDQFDNLVNSFSGDSIKMLQKHISSSDVTGEVFDTRSRMEAKKQTRDRYLELLKQARNMKEILEVQEKINEIQEEIESGTGRVSYLTHQSAYSTIHLQYFQYMHPSNQPKDPSAFAPQVGDAFANGFHVLGNLFILLISIWPLILGSVIAFIFVWKKRKIPAAKTQA